METDKKTEENKTAGSADSSQTIGGFDINKLLSNPAAMELVKHLLSGGGAMAASYFLWLKPMQDRMETMNDRINEQDGRIRELEAKQKQLASDLAEGNQPELKSTGEDYFNLKHKTPRIEGNRKRRDIKL